ncbi:MAG: DEAD/DEAH box helicase family protein [Psychroflexus sp.]
MKHNIDTEQIILYRTLFKGREDVFALRWEKRNKKGYMPAYSFDPYMYRLHKQRGGTFKDYKDKTYLPLDDYQINKHLAGRHFVGIYPLLKDNTSWFIVSDFDKKNWREQAVQAVEVCQDYNICAYLERSRSGNGAHVWMFFDTPYPARKSRKIVLELFERAGIFSKFDKNNSFDRLFPNQDYLSGKGLGNLIALPQQGDAIKQGNSCFIDPKTFIPFENQWDFLQSIERVSTSNLDILFEELFENISISECPKTTSRKFQIRLTGVASLNRNGLPMTVIDFLKENLNFYNSEYAIKKKIGKNTWQTERYFNLIEEKENNIEIPRGFIGSLIRYCRQNSIDYEFSDERQLHNPVELNSNIQLLPHQKIAIRQASKKDFGIIVSPPGSGKTIIGLKLVEQKRQPTLIITHRKQIADQWKQRIETFFGIPKKEIGTIGQGKMKIGKQITVALIQTLTKKIKKTPKKLVSVFGTIIVDECHHIPAKSYREAVHKLAPYYQYVSSFTRLLMKMIKFIL